MQNNGEYLLQKKAVSKEESPADLLNVLKEENQKLKSENAELKRNLEKQEFYQRNLYKQWSELNAGVIYKNRELEQLKSARGPKLKIYQYAFYTLLLIALFIAAFTIFSPLKKDDKGLGNTQVVVPEKQNVPAEDVDKVPPGESLQTNAAGKILDKNVFSKKLAVSNKEDLLNNAAIATSGKKLPARYIVKTKSYFFNKPDNNSQRNTFVLPWNDAYGIVTALDDKNGFIYIVYENRAGRTSKGWIQKKDLEIK